MDTRLQALDQVRATALDMVIKFGPKVLVATIILAAGYVVGRWVGGMLDRVLARSYPSISRR